MKNWPLFIWAITVLVNILLSVLLIAREHYLRFGWLTFNCILSVIADAYFAYMRYGHHSGYMPSRNFLFFLWLGIDLAIIFESWNFKQVRVPMELQVLGGFAQWIVFYSGHKLWAYDINLVLRVTNLIIFTFYLILFSRRTPRELRKEPKYARHDSSH